MIGVKTFNITNRTVSNIKRKYWKLIDSGEVYADRVGAKFKLIADNERSILIVSKKTHGKVSV